MATVDRQEEQIRSSVEHLTRRAVRLYRVRAGLWAIGLVLMATIGFVGLDYSLRVEELGWRWLLSALWLATLVGIGWRWLPDATSFRLTPVQVAQWIERRRPELGDSLSRLLALKELPATDLRYGSMEFRRAASQDRDSTLVEYPWQSFLDKQPTLVAGLFCALSLVAVALLLLAAGPIAAHGFARITLPWSWAPWPRFEQLQLVDAPDMIARESELEIRVIDLAPPFPQLVELELRRDDDDAEVVRLPMRAAEDLAVVTLPAMENDFSIRPVGGDQQDGPWHAIRVARQPLLKEYAFTIQPPSYVNQAVTELVGHRIDVLSGSRVTLKGRFDERLKSLRAIAAGEVKSTEAANTSSAPAANKFWSATLSRDGTSFELFAATEDETLVAEDRRWQFELETVEGLQLIDAKQWMIHVTTDRPPAVTLAPIEPRGITRNAVLNIVGTASDDLELVDVELAWQSASQAPQTIRLWPPDNGAVATDAKPSSSRSVDLSTSWSVATASLSIGQTLTIELVARDSAGQVGKSVPQTLEILDDASALAGLQRQQAEAFAPLRQLLDAQRRNQQSLNRTLEVSRQVDVIGSNEVEAVASAQQLGQSIAGSLARNQDSLTHGLQQLSDQLARNQLGETPLASETARLRTQIAELVNNQLEPALKDTEAAHQAMRAAIDGAGREAALDQLSKAAQSQQQATDQFSKLVESVAAAESLAEFQKQIQELAHDQTAVANQTQRLQVDTVVKGSSAQVDASRAGIQSDQQNLARRVEELAERLGKELQPGEGNNQDTTSQKSIENAHRKLLEYRIGDAMRQAADMVKQNQLSDAQTSQQRASQLLDDVAAEFGGGGSSGLESTSQSMQDMAAQLNSLASAQQQAAEALARAAGAALTTDAKRQLTAQQQSLLDNVRELSSEPSVEANVRLSELLDAAAGAIEQAVERSEQNDFKEAGRSAGQAAESLQAAAQSAQQRADQLKSQVAEQQMFDLRSLLSTAVKRQQPVVASLAQVGESLRDSPTSSNGNINLQELLTTEQQLQQLLAEGRQRLQSLDAFDWLLGQCDDELLRTIAALERRRTGPETLASAKAALDMMQAAEAAVTEAARKDSPAAEDDANANKQETREQKASQLPTLASLRLLREMQTLINQQSEQLLDDSASQSESARTRMADRQQALAEQVARLREQLKQAK